MAFTSILPATGAYPDFRLRWAPTSKPTDASQTFEDISDRLRSWEWGYGRNDELATFEAGTGHVLLSNSDRELDPSYSAGAWFGEIKPRKVFELVAKWATVEYPIFVAYAKGFPQSYPSDGVDAVVKVNLVDAFAILQGVDLVVGFTRPAELSGARIEAVLDAIGVPAALRDIADGTVIVDAIDVTSTGTSGLGHAKSVALDSEMGQLFVAKDGKVTFHDYSRRLNASSLHTFTDTAGAALGYTAVETAFDDTYLWSYIRVTGAAGDDSAETTENAASAADHFTITKTVPTQLLVGSDIKQVADRYALRYAQAEERLPSLPMKGAGNPAARWPVILDLEVSDRVTVEKFADRADPKVLIQNVEGISHTCSPGGPWTTDVATSPADTRTYMVTGDATLGLSDSGNLAA